jgi:hypothetical protein
MFVFIRVLSVKHLEARHGNDLGGCLTKVPYLAGYNTLVKLLVKMEACRQTGLVIWDAAEKGLLLLCFIISHMSVHTSPTTCDGVGVTD